MDASHKKMQLWLNATPKCFFSDMHCYQVRRNRGWGVRGIFPHLSFCRITSKTFIFKWPWIKICPYPTFPDLPTDLVTIVLLCVGKSQIFDNLDGLLNVHE